jgi:hypothetical protein
MKLSIFSIAALHASILNACIVIHSTLEKCNGPTEIIMGDTQHVTAEMYDNGVMVCSGERSKRTSSSDWFPIPCQKGGYTLEISPNGRTVSGLNETTEFPADSI